MLALFWTQWLLLSEKSGQQIHLLWSPNALSASFLYLKTPAFHLQSRRYGGSIMWSNIGSERSSSQEGTEQGFFFFFQGKDLSPGVSVWKLGLCPPCMHSHDNNGHLETPSSATFSGRKSPGLWSSPSKCWREKKNLPLKLTSAELGHRGARGAEALVHILRRQRCQGLINEDLASRDLKMPAFAQVFLPENTELVPGIDAAQKGHSRLLLNEMFCSQHTSFYRHGEKIETRRTKKLSFSGWAGRSAAKFKDRPAVGQAPAACCWGNWGLSCAWAITFLLAVVQSLGCVWLFETPWIAAH